MERIREGVRRRYLAASSRARLIHERDDCNGEISSPKLDSKFKRLVAVLVTAFDFHRGALARAFGYSSVQDLGPFYLKLRVDALFSCSQALNRADFEAEPQTPCELRANFECNPRTSNQPANFASTPLKLLPGFESSCRLPIPSRRELRTSNFSPPELQIKRQTSCRRPLRLLPASNSAPANFKSSEIRFKLQRFDPIPSCIARAPINIAARFEISPPAVVE